MVQPRNSSGCFNRLSINTRPSSDRICKGGPMYTMTCVKEVGYSGGHIVEGGHQDHVAGEDIDEGYNEPVAFACSIRPLYVY